MNEPTATQNPAPSTAGALLRQARQARGLHLMALSASLKVAPARLEAMEQDRWHEMPDAAYARALAHTVSRALGIDPEPVLRALPAAPLPTLDTIDAGIDAPFRDSSVSTGAGARRRRYRWSMVGLGLLLAVGVWAGLERASRMERPASPASQAEPAVIPPALTGASAAAAAAGSQVSGSASASPARESGDAPRNPAALAEAGAVLRVVATQSSWLEVRDLQGQVRLSRLVAPGEDLQLPFSPPVSLTVGNAAATRVWVNGQGIDLAGSTRENVARIELR